MTPSPKALSAFCAAYTGQFRYRSSQWAVIGKTLVFIVDNGGCPELEEIELSKVQAAIREARSKGGFDELTDEQRYEIFESAGVHGDE